MALSTLKDPCWQVFSQRRINQAEPTWGGLTKRCPGTLDSDRKGRLHFDGMTSLATSCHHPNFNVHTQSLAVQEASSVQKNLPNVTFDQSSSLRAILDFAVHDRTVSRRVL